MGWMAGVQFLAGARNSSPQHPASSPMGIGTLSLEVKLPAHESDHSTPFGAKDKNGGAILHSHICLHGVMHN
jgi:hypothetical protein